MGNNIFQHLHNCVFICISTELSWALAAYILLTALLDCMISFAKIVQTSRSPFLAASLMDFWTFASSSLMAVKKNKYNLYDSACIFQNKHIVIVPFIIFFTSLSFHLISFITVIEVNLLNLLISQATLCLKKYKRWAAFTCQENNIRLFLTKLVQNRNEKGDFL